MISNPVLSSKAKRRRSRKLPFALQRQRSTLVDGLVPAFRNSLRRTMSRHVREASEVLVSSSALRRGIIDRWTKESVELKEKHIIKSFTIGYQAAKQDLPNNAKAMEVIDLLPYIKGSFPKIRDWLNSTSLGESRTTARMMEKLFKQAAEKEEATPAQISREIRKKGLDKVNGLPGRSGRADTIARTGVIWSANEGATARYQEAGVVVVEWYTTEDDATCPFCAAMDGIKVRTGDAFWKEDSTMGITSDLLGAQSLSFTQDITHPPLHPRCRCVLLPVLD